MSLTEMAEVIRKMPKLNELMRNYNTHIELTNEVIVQMTKNKIKDLICLE